ncbi:MAG: response regulator transcription factor [Acidobacteria bacterium]|nr:response regulator transcription factor [Acidobacteriota bacterium]
MMKILIVEDNASMRRLIKSIVADLADVVNECSDGAEALAAYTKHRPDWVLMDIKMKELDGIAATRSITALFPGAHVMIVTDYDDEKLREAARSAGACEYVVKEDLFALRRILCGTHGRAERKGPSEETHEE